jgi:hypothetical protein
MHLKLWQILSLIALGICFIVFAVIIVIGKQRKLNEEFHGKITEINYGSKDFVFVKVNDKVYSLGSIGRKIRGKVKINDSVIKYKNDPYYYIVLHTGEVLKY